MQTACPNNGCREDDGMIVPHDRLSPEALKGLIEEFVTRPGTDTGYTRGSLEESVAAVLRQLERGTACIVYDEASGTANIVPREKAKGPPLPAGGEGRYRRGRCES